MQRVWSRIVETGGRCAETGTRLSREQAQEIVVALFEDLNVEFPAPEVLRHLGYSLARRTWYKGR